MSNLEALVWVIVVLAANFGAAVAAVLIGRRWKP